MQALNSLVGAERELLVEVARVAPPAQVGVGEGGEFLGVAVLLALEEGAPRRRQPAPTLCAFRPLQGAHRAPQELFHPK